MKRKDNSPVDNFLTRFWPLLSLIAGAFTTLAFAPFDQSWLVFITLALPFYLWTRLTAKQAAISAWLYGLGLQCTGVSWIYYSLHVHGSAPVIFALLLIFLLSCYLSIYTALSAYTVNRFLPASPIMRLMIFYPASWVLFEWSQGYVMTGFAWMQLGYTQIDLPLSGFAPVFGNHAVSGLIAFCAGVVALVILQLGQKNYKAATVLVMPVLLLWVTGGVLKPVDWTQAEGDAIRVSVIQGNIPQTDKWKLHMKKPTMDMYRELTLAQQDADLIIWPETAVPSYRYRVEPYIRELHQQMEQRDTDLLLGIFVKNDKGRVLNSVVNVNGDAYHKRHLVPLGEYIPLRFLIEFFNRFVKIPMSDITSGEEDQPLLVAAGVPLGINVCFEEAFARDVIKDLPAAKLLINVSNDAWFEDSIEPHQHHVIARMRALEAGRYMIRSTNTGITSLIGPHGEVIDQLPQFERGVLSGSVQPMVGATPFVRWGDWLIVGACSLLLLAYAVIRRRNT